MCSWITLVLEVGLVFRRPQRGALSRETSSGELVLGWQLESQLLTLTKHLRARLVGVCLLGESLVEKQWVFLIIFYY